MSRKTDFIIYMTEGMNLEKYMGQITRSKCQEERGNVFPSREEKLKN